MVIHQMLHGYKRGHQLLASDFQLDSESLDLITRLSDLSGSMTLDSRVHPYITSYPLPDGKYYAVAKTWLDTSAPRAGCVLTHTLILPMDDWAKNDNLAGLAKLFVKPKNSDDTLRYCRQIKNPVTVKLQEIKIDSDLVTEFVSRYFGEGIDPIIWFTDEYSEDYYWLLINSLWPQLRAQFSCCTNSLQPRYLYEKPFKLMFAPKASYSRFQQFPHECLIEKGNLFFSSTSHLNIVEPWIREWSRQIIGYSSNSDNFDLDVNSEITKLGPYLTSDPTDIKKLFLVREFRKRSTESPMAAIGLLDMVESLAPDETAAVDYKEQSVLIAIESLSQLNTVDEIMKCLLLISDRLSRIAYRQLSLSVTSAFVNKVSDNVASEPATAFRTAERALNNSIDVGSSPYMIGLIRGIDFVGRKNPNKLGELRQFPEVAKAIICIKPKIGIYYMNSGILVDDRDGLVSDLASWISNIVENQDLKNLRTELLPEVKGDQYKPLAEELLRQINGNDIEWVLNTLNISTRGFISEGIRNILREKVSRQFPEETQRWAVSVRNWSPGIAILVSATYQDGLDGLISIINSTLFHSNGKSQILSAYIQSISTNHNLPQWFHEFSNKDRNLLPALLNKNIDLSTITIKAVNKVIDEVWELPWASSFSAVEISSIVSKNINQITNNFVPSVMRSVLSKYLSGEFDWSDFEDLLATDWGGGVDRRS